MIVRLLVCCALALGSVACSDSGSGEGAPSAQEASPEALEEYETNGEIRALEGMRLDIAHEEIPDYMPAMTMPFFATDEAAVDGLAVGDSVHFVFTPQEGGRHVILEIEKRD